MGHGDRRLEPEHECAFYVLPKNVDFELLLTCSLIRRLGNSLDLPAPSCSFLHPSCLAQTYQLQERLLPNAAPLHTCCPPGSEQRRQQRILGATNRPVAQSRKKQVKFTLQSICTPCGLATSQIITSRWWRVAPTERVEGPGCPVHPPVPGDRFPRFSEESAQFSRSKCHLIDPLPTPRDSQLLFSSPSEGHDKILKLTVVR